jgi:HSP20 family protein
LKGGEFIMALIPWKPFEGMDQYFNDDNWFFPIFSGNQASGPIMDLYETDKEVIAEANLPGVNPDNVNVAIEDGMLRISGVTEQKSEEKKKGYWRKEIRKGSFDRAIHLPVDIQENKIKATYEKGVLKIVMPKDEKKIKKTKIKIQDKDKK